MSISKVEFGIGALAVLCAVAALTVEHQGQEKLATAHEKLAQQMARLTTETETVSNQVNGARETASTAKDQLNELRRLRGEVGLLREQAEELGNLRRENQHLLSKIAAQSAPTNELSAEEICILQQTHVSDAVNTLLLAIKRFATDHSGQYPTSFAQLTSSGALAVSNFAGNLSLNDFELRQPEITGLHGRKLILRNRLPIPNPEPGEPAVWVYGSLEGGQPSWTITSEDFAKVDAEGTRTSPPSGE